MIIGGNSEHLYITKLGTYWQNTGSLQIDSVLVSLPVITSNVSLPVPLSFIGDSNYTLSTQSISSIAQTLTVSAGVLTSLSEQGLTITLPPASVTISGILSLTFIGGNSENLYITGRGAYWQNIVSLPTDNVWVPLSAITSSVSLLVPSMTGDSNYSLSAQSISSLAQTLTVSADALTSLLEQGLTITLPPVSVTINQLLSLNPIVANVLPVPLIVSGKSNFALGTQLLTITPQAIAAVIIPDVTAFLATESIITSALPLRSITGSVGWSAQQKATGVWVKEQNVT